MKKKTVHITFDIEKLPEGYYLATSPEVQGLVAQAKTFEQVVEIAHDLARTLLRTQKENIKERSERIFYPTQVTI